MKKFLKIFVIFVILIVLTLLYSRFISTKGLFVKEYKVVNSIITEQYHGLKIVHISDIHYGSTIYDKQLQNLVEKVNEIKPDIVVFTGDLFTDNKTYDKEIIIQNLSKMHSKLGKYYISGNHDKPIEDYQTIMDQSGFKNLDDNYELIYNNSKEPIVLSGISTNYDDSSNIGIKTSKFDTYIADVKEEEKPIYSILLIHEPDFIDKLNLDHYNLILSGHSHGGQVRLPLIGKLFTPYGSQKYYDEYYKISNTDLYISSGIGNSKANLRFFNHPSFNFYRVTNK